MSVLARVGTSHRGSRLGLLPARRGTTFAGVGACDCSPSCFSPLLHWRRCRRRSSSTRQHVQSPRRLRPAPTRAPTRTLGGRASPSKRRWVCSDRWVVWAPLLSMRQTSTSRSPSAPALQSPGGGPRRGYVLDCPCCHASHLVLRLGIRLGLTVIRSLALVIAARPVPGSCLTRGALESLWSTDPSRGFASVQRSARRFWRRNLVSVVRRHLATPLNQDGVCSPIWGSRSDTQWCPADASISVAPRAMLQT